MVNTPRLPIDIKVIAYYFILTGAISAYGIIQEFRATNYLNLNFYAVSLFVGWYLLMDFPWAIFFVSLLALLNIILYILGAFSTLGNPQAPFSLGPFFINLRSSNLLSWFIFSLITAFNICAIWTLLLAKNRKMIFRCLWKKLNKSSFDCESMKLTSAASGI